MVAQEETILLLENIPVEQRRQVGALPWYGAGYTLEDFLVYTFYGHKREHGAQIDGFRSRLDPGDGRTSERTPTGTIRERPFRTLGT